ncbi:unnamed protein product [Polarella glacialis]|uniref:Uncharacterized protein n=1 Tax=Polarella glacialis TaxID=89957 RepID=A0A813G0R1_POLGL|nr:unnamed protein product [Polarella glacialis]
METILETCDMVEFCLPKGPEASDEAHLIDCLAINQWEAYKPRFDGSPRMVEKCPVPFLMCDAQRIKGANPDLFYTPPWGLRSSLSELPGSSPDSFVSPRSSTPTPTRTHQTKKSPGGWMETLKGGGHYNFKQDEDENTKDETDDQDAMAENEAGEEEKDEEDKDQEEKEDEKKEKKEEEKKEEAERRLREPEDSFSGASDAPPGDRYFRGRGLQFSRRFSSEEAGVLPMSEEAGVLPKSAEVQSAGQGSIGKMPGTMPMPTDPIAECRPLKTVSIFHILNLAAPEIMHEFTFVTLVRVVIMFPLVGLFCVGFFWGKDLYNRAKYGYAQVGHPSQMLLMPAFGTTSAVQPSSALDTMMASRLAFISPGRQRPGEFQMTQPLMLQVPSAPLPSAAMRPGLQV